MVAGGNGSVHFQQMAISGGGRAFSARRGRDRLHCSATSIALRCDRNTRQPKTCGGGFDRLQRPRYFITIRAACPMGPTLLGVRGCLTRVHHIRTLPSCAASSTSPTLQCDGNAQGNPILWSQAAPEAECPAPSQVPIAQLGFTPPLPPACLPPSSFCARISGHTWHNREMKRVKEGGPAGSCLAAAPQKHIYPSSFPSAPGGRHPECRRGGADSLRPTCPRCGNCTSEGPHGNTVCV